MKIVPDATVLIRAHHRSRAFARRLFHEILERGHRLVLSNEMIAEVTRVLRYPHFQGLYGLTDADLLEYTQLLQSVADIVILDPRYRAPFPPGLERRRCFADGGTRRSRYPVHP